MRRLGAAGFVVAGLFLVGGPVFGGAADDSEMARKVEDQLRRSAIVGHLRIAAKAKDGRVSLDGRVRTLAQAWEAANLASKVRGVAEVDNRVEIESRGTSDAAIETAVKRRFQDIPDVAAAGLSVSVEAGNVALSGKLRDARIRFTAADAAAQVEGVVGVDDRIETPEKDDESIRKAVAGIFSNRSLVRVAGKIESKVEKGVVTLEGRVDRLYDRRQATRLVLGINGVRAVENHLEIKPSNSDLLIPLS